MTGLLIPQTTVLNQLGFVLFIGVSIDTFIVRTVLVPAAVTAFSLEGSSFKFTSKGISFADEKQVVTHLEDGTAVEPYLNQVPDDHEVKSTWRYKDADANWWPSMMPRVLLSPMGEHEALWAGYDCPHFYLRHMKGIKECSTDPSTAENEITDEVDAVKYIGDNPSENSCKEIDQATDVDITL